MGLNLQGIGDITATEALFWNDRSAKWLFKMTYMQRLKGFSIGSPSFMGNRVKMLPYLTYGRVLFKFWCANTILYTTFFKSVVELVEDDGSDPFVLITWVYAYQIENNVLTSFSIYYVQENEVRTLFSIW